MTEVKKKISISDWSGESKKPYTSNPKCNKDSVSFPFLNF